MYEWHNLKIILFSLSLHVLSDLPTVYCNSVSEKEQNVLVSSSPFVLLLSAFIVVVLCVVLIILCGGCTGMEVGTDSHPASRGGYGSGQYDPVVTDANTRTLYSSTTMPGDDPYNSNAHQPLPYSLNPGGVEVAQGFTGYQATTGDYQGVRTEPPPPSYNESMRGNNFTGWSQ